MHITEGNKISNKTRWSIAIVSWIILVVGLSSCNAINDLIGQEQNTTPTLEISPTNTEQLEVVSPVVPRETPSFTPTLPAPTSTITILPAATETLKPSATPTPEFPYTFQLGAPLEMPNIFRSEEGCLWQGVAGQVFGADDEPVQGLVVEVGGSLGSQSILGLSLTGGAPIYGEGGYEIKLADEPIATENSLWIVVKDLQDNQLSQKYFFDTHVDCDKNLILINFTEKSRSVTDYYFPLINR